MRTAVAAFDVGGTHSRLRGGWTEDPEHVELKVRTADHPSLEELLLACLRQAELRPAHLVLAVAGRVPAHGTVQLTNLPDWPPFDSADFADRHGVRVRVVNDMTATAHGMADLGPDEVRPLTRHDPAARAGELLAVSVGSGVGSALLDEHGVVHTSESGHVTWQPVNEFEAGYLSCLQQELGGVVTVEESIGGLRGFDRMYDYVSRVTPPGPALDERVSGARRTGAAVAPVLTSAALAGDPCGVEVVRLFAAVFGQYLRGVVLVCLPAGGVVTLTSGVLQAPGVAELLCSGTEFLDRFVSPGACHHDLLAEIPVRLALDPLVGVRGAYRLAVRDAGGHGMGSHQPPSPRSAADSRGPHEPRG
ncbi:glucokinase [Streptomyces sp. NPDC029674]|uniref:glucokinase n=1 Tax=Streptomyces sp. NPDC029674 TaxID=3365297 RepID=UPI00384BA2BD